MKKCACCGKKLNKNYHVRAFRCNSCNVYNFNITKHLTYLDNVNKKRKTISFIKRKFTKKKLKGGKK